MQRTRNPLRFERHSEMSVKSFEATSYVLQLALRSGIFEASAFVCSPSVRLDQIDGRLEGAISPYAYPISTDLQHEVMHAFIDPESRSSIARRL